MRFTIRQHWPVLFLAAWGCCPIAIAQSTDQLADDYRGGWRTDQGEPHTYEFSIRGDQVRGIYCTYCADATTLAFVDGKLGADGVFQASKIQAKCASKYEAKPQMKTDASRASM